MPAFRVTIEVGDPKGERFEPLEALVDTGATYTWVARSILERLGLQPLWQRPFVLADGREVLYHIGFEKPINVELVFEVDVLSSDRAGVVDLLYLISKEGATKDEMNRYWADKLALSAPNIVRALLSDDVIDEMRKEFRQLTGYRLSPEEIRRLLLSQVVRPDVAEVAGGTGAVRKTRKRRGRPPKTPSVETQP